MIFLQQVCKMILGQALQFAGGAGDLGSRPPNGPFLHVRAAEDSKPVSFFGEAFFSSDDIFCDAASAFS